MWNRQIDAFDVDGLVEQVASTGAGYLLFTIDAFTSTGLTVAEVPTAAHRVAGNSTSRDGRQCPIRSPRPLSSEFFRKSSDSPPPLTYRVTASAM